MNTPPVARPGDQSNRANYTFEEDSSICDAISDHGSPLLKAATPLAMTDDLLLHDANITANKCAQSPFQLSPNSSLKLSMRKSSITSHSTSDIPIEREQILLSSPLVPKHVTLKLNSPSCEDMHDEDEPLQSDSFFVDDSVDPNSTVLPDISNCFSHLTPIKPVEVLTSARSLGRVSISAKFVSRYQRGGYLNENTVVPKTLQYSPDSNTSSTKTSEDVLDEASLSQTPNTTRVLQNTQCPNTTPSARMNNIYPSHEKRNTQNESLLNNSLGNNKENLLPDQEEDLTALKSQSEYHEIHLNGLSSVLSDCSRHSIDEHMSLHSDHYFDVGKQRNKLCLESSV
jgi:hypothetical protein